MDSEEIELVITELERALAPGALAVDRMELARNLRQAGSCGSRTSTKRSSRTWVRWTSRMRSAGRSPGARRSWTTMDGTRCRVSSEHAPTSCQQAGIRHHVRRCERCGGRDANRGPGRRL